MVVNAGPVTEDREYKAFLSYGHVSDIEFAPVLQSALERFAKPWYRSRNCRIFRDTTNLSATPELWPTIAKALSGSEFLIFLASSVAANSRWVKRELVQWRKQESGGSLSRLMRKPVKRLVIVLTEGSVVWDAAARDFDWTRTTALPRVLQGAFTTEPLYVDMRGFRGARISLDDKVFLDCVATIAAALHRKSKDEIFGEHIRQHRRTMRLVWSFALSFAIVAVFAVVFGVQAENRRAQIQRELSHAKARLFVYTVGNSTDNPSQEEVELLWQLATADSRVRYDYLKQSLENPGNAERLSRRRYRGSDRCRSRLRDEKADR